jgi:hypothetical protein
MRPTVAAPAKSKNEAAMRNHWGLCMDNFYTPATQANKIYPQSTENGGASSYSKTLAVFRGAFEDAA